MSYNNKTPLEKAEYANETKGILISSLNNKGLNITSNDSFRDIANMVNNIVIPSNNPYSLMKYSKLLIDGGALYTDDQEICEFIFPSLYDSTYDYNLLPEAFQFSVLDKTNNSFKVYWMESLGGSTVYYDDINSQIYLYVDQGTPQLTYCSTLKIDNLDALPNWSNNINGINSEWVESLNKYSWNTINMENLTSNIYFNLLDENYEFYISSSIVNAPDVASSAFSSQIREGYIAYDRFGRIINGSLTTRNNVNILNNRIILGTGVINIKTTAGYYTSNSILSINNLGLASKIGLTPNILANGTQILNIIGTMDEGINTSDANALAEDIAYGKTAYVNGVKLTGTMENLEPVIQNQANIINNLYNTVNTLQAEVDNKGQYSNKFALIPGTRFSGSTFTSIQSELLDISILNNLDLMFNYCINLIELDLSSWDISNISSLYGTFNYCNNLINLNISTWNIGTNIINLSQTFSGCSNLTNLDVSNWDISNVTNISSIFAGCSNLTNLDVSNWDTSNIIGINGVFSGCKNITTLNISNWNIYKARDFSSTFSGCSNLTTLDVSNWNTNIRSVYYMFSGCNNLVDINVSNWKIDFGNTYNLRCMFQYCNNLSDNSIDSIINMCLNIQNIPNTYKNINNNQYYSPFINTNISSTRYQNRWAELTAAGWNY